MKEGDKIIWKYKHWLKAYTKKRKTGVILKIKEPYAIVQLEGNKHPSKKLIAQLEEVKE